MRVRMSQIDRELLFTKAKRRFSTRELGDLVSVSPRTIRSWQSGDTLVRYAAFKKLLVIAGLTEGQVAHKNLPEFWHTKDDYLSPKIRTACGTCGNSYWGRRDYALSGSCNS